VQVSSLLLAVLSLGASSSDSLFALAISSNLIYTAFIHCLTLILQIPNYSFVLHQRTEETTYLYGAAVIIIEGLFVLHDKAIRDVLDLKVFVQVSSDYRSASAPADHFSQCRQCDSDLMLARRLRRDLVERGRDAAGVLDQFVLPSLSSLPRSPLTLLAL